MKIAAILESLKDDSKGRALAVFLDSNWGLAVAIKNKLKFKCSNDELLSLTMEAHETAVEKFDDARSKQNSDTKYEFVHHWAQHLKSLIVAEKRRERREVSYEEILETNPGVLSGSRLYARHAVPCESTLADILQMVSLKKAEEIALMIHAGCDEEKISLELNLPIEQVAVVVTKMDEVRAAAAS